MNFSEICKKIKDYAITINKYVWDDYNKTEFPYWIKKIISLVANAAAIEVMIMIIMPWLLTLNTASKLLYITVNAIASFATMGVALESLAIIFSTIPDIVLFEGDIEEGFLGIIILYLLELIAIVVSMPILLCKSVIPTIKNHHKYKKIETEQKHIEQTTTKKRYAHNIEKQNDVNKNEKEIYKSSEEIGNKIEELLDKLKDAPDDEKDNILLEIKKLLLEIKKQDNSKVQMEKTTKAKVLGKKRNS